MADKSKAKKEAKKPSKDATAPVKTSVPTKLTKEEKGKAGCGTVIRSCSCKHEWQDKTYGSGRRVHNVGGTTTATYTCTVCGNTQR